MKHAPKIIVANEPTIPTEQVDQFHYQIVILREDMLEKIRQIVREEIEREWA